MSALLRFDDSASPHGKHDIICRPVAAAPREEPRWMPYVNNGGTALAVAGDSFVVAAADTRLSEGFRIHSRNCSKISKLTEKVIICTSGMQAEILTLHRVLKSRIILYEHDHRKPPSVEAIAQMLSTILYYKRFFPYYTFNVLAGVDSSGKGAVYSYDAVGNVNREDYSASGTGSALVYSILDNQVAKNNQLIKGDKLTKLETVDLCKDAIASATERDIQTGDAAEIFVVDASGVSSETLCLKTD